MSRAKAIRVINRGRDNKNVMSKAPSSTFDQWKSRWFKSGAGFKLTSFV